MHEITQTDSKCSGQVGVYADSFIITIDGNVIHMSTFGTTSAMKSITAQIVNNRNGILINGDDGYIKTVTEYPIHLKRGYDQVRTITKNIRPGIVNRIFYSENLFRPWKVDGERIFLAFGETEEQARSRTFSVADKISEIPLKETWKDWLWEILTVDWQWPETDLIIGGVQNLYQFSRWRV